MRWHHPTGCEIVLALWIAVAGCKGIGSESTPQYVPSGQINFDDGYEATIKESINQAVPAGTPVAEAKRIFEESGCECSVESKHGKEELRCAHIRKHSMWVTMVWQILGSVEEGRVTDLNCRQYGIGP